MNMCLSDSLAIRSVNSQTSFSEFSSGIELIYLFCFENGSHISLASLKLLRGSERL